MTTPNYLDHILNGAMILDDELVVLSWNHWLEVHTNIKRADIIDRRITDYFPCINTNLLKRKLMQVKMFNAPAFVNVDAEKYLLKIPTKKISGNVFEYMLQNVVISAFDREAGQYLFMIYDQTSLYETKYKLEDSTNKLKEYLTIVNENIAICSIDADNRVTSVSDAYCRLCGFAPAEIIGKGHNELFKPDCAESDASFDHDASREIKKTDKMGKTFWTQSVLTPIISAEGSQTGFLCIDHDITDKKRIEELSVTDKLTQVYNRIRLDEALGTEFYRYQRYGDFFSVVIFDIDFFKKVNDSYGHLAGDEVLKGVSQLVKSLIRKCDIFGRWGGEEFLVICCETTASGAAILSEKLRKAIENHIFLPEKQITCSFGVAEIDNSGTDNMLKRADDALYKAKQNGRNRVELFSE